MCACTQKNLDKEEERDDIHMELGGPITANYVTIQIGPIKFEVVGASDLASALNALLAFFKNNYPSKIYEGVIVVGTSVDNATRYATEYFDKLQLYTINNEIFAFTGQLPDELGRYIKLNTAGERV